MKQYIYMPYGKSYKVTYSTNQIGTNERLFINEIKNEVNGAQKVGLPLAAVALGFPDEFVEITKTTLEALAVSANHTLLVISNDSGLTTKNSARNIAAEILTFSLPGSNGAAVIDSTAGTIAVAYVHGSTVNPLTATFTLSTAASAKVATTTQVSGVTTNNFTSPVTYVVTSEHGETKSWVVTVTVA